MSQGLYHHIRATWKRPKDALPHMYRQTRMAEWRREPVNCRIERPTRLDAARRMGYKAKQGVVVIRTRVRRGGLRKSKINMKRKPSKMGMKKITMGKNIQRMAEERVARHFPNMEVLNSYWVGQDAVSKFFEVIVVDPNHNAIRRDPRINWISSNKHNRREIRGLTSAGMRYRGLRQKGYRAHNTRPSRRANWRRHNVQKIRRG